MGYPCMATTTIHVNPCIFSAKLDVHRRIPHRSTRPPRRDGRPHTIENQYYTPTPLNWMKHTIMRVELSAIHNPLDTFPALPWQNLQRLTNMPPCNSTRTPPPKNEFKPPPKSPHQGNHHNHHKPGQQITTNSSPESKSTHRHVYG